MFQSINKKIFWFLVFIGFLPIMVGIILSLPPLGLLILFVFMLWIFPRFGRGVSRFFSGCFSIFGILFKGIAGSFLWISGRGIHRTRFMGIFERGLLLRSSHTGFLMDGKKARLSEEASYESIIIQGGMGRGKSSGFVMPNLLNPSPLLPSFVTLDTSGEIYQKTSGFLRRKGYDICVFNLMDGAHSDTYNPLDYCNNRQDIAALAKILVKSSQGNARSQMADPFWEQSAEKLIRIMAQCLMNQPDAAMRNLSNLRHLVTSFDAHIAPTGQLGKIDQFVMNATQQDQLTFSTYHSFVQGNLKTIQSVLMSADVALDSLATPQMAALTASSSFSFDQLRGRPTALYVMVNQTQIPHYVFILNLFYAHLFKTLLKDQHNLGRPVWLFLDEFGHLQIPDFEIFATTARKYKVMFALFLQSLSQLESRYGLNNTKVILEGTGSEIYLPGMALDTAQALEARLGRFKQSPLMAANEIIRMKEGKALLLYANRLPVKLRVQRYYQSLRLNYRSKIKPATLPQASSSSPPLIQL